MCECACGNIEGQLRFPAPDGDVYILDIYPGCRDCDTPAGVTIYRFTQAEVAEWHVGDARPLRVDNAGAAVSVIGARVLAETMLSWLRAVDGEYEAEGAIEDGVDECFYTAARKTIAEWEALDRENQGVQP